MRRGLAVWQLATGRQKNWRHETFKKKNRIMTACCFVHPRNCDTDWIAFCGPTPPCFSFPHLHNAGEQSQDGEEQDQKKCTLEYSSCPAPRKSGPSTGFSLLPAFFALLLVRPLFLLFPLWAGHAGKGLLGHDASPMRCTTGSHCLCLQRTGSFVPLHPFLGRLQMSRTRHSSSPQSGVLSGRALPCV